MNIQNALFVSILTLLSFDAHAEPEKSAYVSPAPVVTMESMLQMVAGLLLVLFIIGAIAWLLKRFSIFPQAASGAIKIIASASVGQRERVVIVEVEDARLVLGVTSQQIHTLHRLPKVSMPDSEFATKENSSVKESFPEKLSRTLGNKDDA